MSGPSTYEPKYAAAKWMDQRLPIIRMGADFMTFPSPRNLNYWYTFGGILALCLVGLWQASLLFRAVFRPI